MIQHCPVLIVLLPLTAALLCLLFSKFNKNLGFLAGHRLDRRFAGLLAAGTASNSDQRRSDPLLDGQLGTAFGH